MDTPVQAEFLCEAVLHSKIYSRVGETRDTKSDSMLGLSLLDPIILIAKANKGGEYTTGKSAKKKIVTGDSQPVPDGSTIGQPIHATRVWWNPNSPVHDWGVERATLALYRCTGGGCRAIHYYSTFYRTRFFVGVAQPSTTIFNNLDPRVRFPAGAIFFFGCRNLKFLLGCGRRHFFTICKFMNLQRKFMNLQNHHL